jgi:hypothetical protein
MSDTPISHTGYFALAHLLNKSSTRVWDDAVKSCEKHLGQNEYNLVQRIGSERQLVEFYKRQGKDGSDRIKAVEPVIQQLKSLHDVISLFCPGSDPITALIWGSFTCILEV